MIGHLYRYSHPFYSDDFIYVGQGANRDQQHRFGKSSFGRRFKKKFPGAELPQPIREEIEVVDQEHLNSMETAWMVLYRTLHNLGGMNLLLPGSLDYKNMGKLAVESGQLASIRSLGGRVQGLKNIETGQISALGKSGVGGRISGLIQGPIQGKKNVESGHLASIQKMGGLIQGRNNAKNKTGVCGRTAEEMSESGRIQGRRCSENKTGVCGRTVIEMSETGRFSTHIRWHVKRNIISSICKYCKVT